MSARHFLENHWPSITIAVTATAIAGAFLVMLRSMPPHQIVMATGREGDVYYEIGERYRAALSYENVQVQLMPTAGSVENLAMLRDPNSGVSVALIEGGILSAADTSGVESLGTVFYEPLWWFHKREILGEAANRLRGQRISIGPEGSGTRALTLELLKRTGMEAQVGELLALEPREAGEKLGGADRYGVHDDFLGVTCGAAATRRRSRQAFELPARRCLYRALSVSQ